MDEYLRDFVQESEENITELNNALLELERDPDDDEAMGRIFRMAHTLKGNAGAMGFEEASNLAHAIEDLLEGVRSGQVAVTPELMDEIFAGVDELETMLDDLRASGEIRTDASETIETLRAVKAAETGIPTISDPDDAALDEAIEAATDLADENHDVYHVRLAINESDEQQNGRLVVKALADAFDLLGTVPDEETLASGEYDGTVDAVFGSAVGEAAISAALDPVDAVADDRITEVTDRYEASRVEEDVMDDEFDDLFEEDPGSNIDSETAQDMSVDDLLSEFDEYDDLDAMVEEMDDVSGFDDLGDAGSFDDLDFGDEADGTDDGFGDSVADDDLGFEDDESTGVESTPEPEPEPAEDPDEEVDDAAATFAELKAEVDPVGFDELQDELAELEFDEYSDEEEVGFDELLGDDFEESDDDFFSQAESEIGSGQDEVTMAELVGDDEIAGFEDAGDDEVADDLTDDVGTGAETEPDVAEAFEAAEDADTADTADVSDTDAEDAFDDEVDDLLEEETGTESAADAAGDVSESMDTDVEADAADDSQPADVIDESDSVDAADAESAAETVDTDVEADAPPESAESESEEPVGSASETADVVEADEAVEAGASTEVDTDDSADGSTDDDSDDAGSGGFGDSSTGGFDEAGDFDSGVDVGGFDDDLGDDFELDAADPSEPAAAAQDVVEADSGFEDRDTGDVDTDAPETDDLDADDGAETDEQPTAEETDDDRSPLERARARSDRDLDDVEVGEFELDASDTTATSETAVETGDFDAIGESEFDTGGETATDTGDFGGFDDPGVDYGDFDDPPAGSSAAGEDDESAESATSGPVVDASEYEVDIQTLSDEAEDADTEGEIQSIRVDVEQVDRLLNLVEGLVTSRVRLRRTVEEGADPAELDDELDELEDLTGELQDTVMDVRLVPVKMVVNTLPRVVRDISREQDKQVAFEMEGQNVEVDRSILDQISDPLVHIVRNAVDHGIEDPAEREARDKPAEGHVTLRVERARDQVVIEVEDDGRGLDADRLREEAVEEGILTDEEADALSDSEAYELVFHPGLSTASEVTDVSGRGVGMDVVKSTVNDLDGTVTVESEQGEGTTIRMLLPVTVAIADVLFVESGDEEFGVPVNAVRDIGPAVDVREEDGQEVIVDGDETLPLIRLNEALETPGTPRNGDGMYLRIRSEVRPIAVHCDEVRGQQEVVVKPFEGVLGGIPGLSGATVLGEGEVVNILDVKTL
ncbi:Hpt domain-containing protein [Haloarchaeobius sp. DT45]|uniref:Hpt domain-containing protein n=1 Tax=Haloarchaeobius sp. DT45 TaxID=3446116 RepID=UPI003F6D659E